MAALPTPEPAARRYDPYIQELREFYASSGLSFGSPDDLAPAAERLQNPGSFVEDLSSLIRSIVLREGGAVPHAALLQILVISLAGGEIDQPSEQLREPLRSLLLFVTGVLRRPWNEPPPGSLPQPLHQSASFPQPEPISEPTGPASPILESSPGLAAALVAAGSQNSAAFADELPQASLPQPNLPSEATPNQPVSTRPRHRFTWMALPAIPLILLLALWLVLHLRSSESISTTQPKPQATIPKPSAMVLPAVSPGARSSTTPLSRDLSTPGSPFEISSGIMASHLASARPPSYPVLARIANIQGQVVLQAVISQDGSVVATRVLSGHRLLRSAATNAVRRWHYRPYIADGRPVNVATIVTVDFHPRH